MTQTYRLYNKWIEIFRPNNESEKSKHQIQWSFSLSLPLPLSLSLRLPLRLPLRENPNLCRVQSIFEFSLIIPSLARNGGTQGGVVGYPWHWCLSHRNQFLREKGLCYRLPRIKLSIDDIVYCAEILDNITECETRVKAQHKKCFECKSVKHFRRKTTEIQTKKIGVNSVPTTTDTNSRLPITQWRI